MTTPSLRTRLQPLLQQLALVSPGWTIAVCSTNAQAAVIADLVLEQPRISRSIAEFFSQLEQPIERLLVISDDSLPDGGADQLMQQLRSSPLIGCCRCLIYLPAAVSDGRLQRIWQCVPEGLLRYESGGNGSGLRALISLVGGEHCLDPVFAGRLQRCAASTTSASAEPLPEARPCSAQELSANEQELIVALAHGQRVSDIAARRQLRCDSLRRQLSHLYRRTGVQGQRGLVAWGLDQGLLRPHDLVQQLH